MNRRRDDEDEDDDQGEEQSQPHRKVIKRIRQACTNCRQKKIRCSGDRPCKLCRKLSQSCSYHATSQSERPRRISSISVDVQSNQSLPFRVSMIESKLAELISCIQGSASQLPNMETTNQSPQQLDLDGADFDSYHSEANSGEKDGSVIQGRNEQSWITMPPLPVLQAAADVYFLHCHNQPYSYFHEESFRLKLAEGTLPEYLIFAFLATAVRFSTDEYFQNKQNVARDDFATASWKAIVTQQLTQEDGMDLQVVQAANLLAIIDFTESRLRLAWMKIGLAVRIAQDLRLMHEPSSDISYIEQEERRRIFWSVYLLDKLVSCGRSRPPGILNADCRVLLPCDESTFRQGLQQKSQTIDKLLDESASLSEQPSTFALAILMASILGSCARYSLHESSADETYPPWDSRSEFARITSSLVCFESYADPSEGALAAKISHSFTVSEMVDNQQAGHLVFAHTLWHISHCLLHHPFLLRKRLEKFSRNAPSSFLSTAFRTCVKHAGMLSSVLQEAIHSNCLAETSFYSYCLTVSGTVHCLFLNSADDAVRESSNRYLEINLGILSQLSRYWNHATLMAAGLTKFRTKVSRYNQLILPVAPIDDGLSITDIEDIWSLVDYGLMSKAAASAIDYSRAPVTEWSPSTWLDTGDGPDTNMFGSSMVTGDDGMAGHNYMADSFNTIGQDFSEQALIRASDLDVIL